jgi:hypothetical protein
MEIFNDNYLSTQESIQRFRRRLLHKLIVSKNQSSLENDPGKRPEELLNIFSVDYKNIKV